jgi:hypothetical protein
LEAGDPMAQLLEMVAKRVVESPDFVRPVQSARVGADNLAVLEAGWVRFDCSDVPHAAATVDDLDDVPRANWAPNALVIRRAHRTNDILTQHSGAPTSTESPA